MTPIFANLALLLALASTAMAAVVDATFTAATSVPVTAAGYTATGNEVNLALAFAPPTGTNLTVINNTGPAFIDGRFSNLAQGQVVVITYHNATYRFVANYYGGTGNDVVLHWASTNVYAWGHGQQGQLGNYSNVNSNGNSVVPGMITAFSVLAGKTVTSVAAGGFHSIAVCSDGTLATWGRNLYGELGNNSTVDSEVPVDITHSGVLAGKTVVATAGGDFFSLALATDGTVAAWGENRHGGLGNNTTSNSLIPVAVTTSGALAGKTVTAVAAGLYHALALCSDGTLVAWGGNSAGQLGNGSTTDSWVPVSVSTTEMLAGKTVVAIAAGNAHSMALCADGTLAAWGSNFNGQLGNGNTINSNVPVDITSSGVLAGKSVTAIAAGYAHNLVLCSDGSLVTWGANQSAQLGNSGIVTRSTVPVAVSSSSVLAGKTVTSILAGGFHNVVFCSDRTMAAWGENSYGQLGNTTTTGSSSPVAVSTSSLGGGERFTTLARSARGDHTLALATAPAVPDGFIIADLKLSSGTLFPNFTSGNTSYSVCVPNSTTELTITPTAVHPNDGITVNGVPVATGTTSPAIPLTLGYNNIAVTVMAMDGATTSYGITVLRPAAINFTYIAAESVPLAFPAYDATGNTVDLALAYAPPTGASLTVVRNTGVDFIAGRFSNLAQGQVVTLAYENSIYKFVADYHGGTGNDLVLHWANGKTHAWGYNMSGQIGNGSSGPVAVTSPVTISNSGALAGRTVAALAAGGSHSLALCTDGTLAAWGSNNYGQYGNGTTNTSKVPLLIPRSGALAGKTMVAIAAGIYHSVFLSADGTLASCGYNTSGQLGNNSTASSSIPVPVSTTGVLGGKSVVAVSAGHYHNLALCADGTLAAWGYNNAGQLGDNSLRERRIPVPVTVTGALSGKVVTAIASGSSHNLALCLDGTLVAWGANDAGQLGNNSTTSSSVPVAVTNSGVLAGKTVVAIAAGGSHSLALCADGTLATWGSNSSGQLGNNSAANSSLPVNIMSIGVLAGKTVVAVTAGNSHSLARCADGTLAAWGYNYYGALGNTGTINSNIPVAVAMASTGLRERFTALAVGPSSQHTMALTAVPLPVLSALSLGRVPFGPAFASGTTSYSSVVPYAVDSTMVTPATLDANATITVDGTTVASGSSSAIPLAVGINSISIIVASSSGTRTAYTLTVTRAASMLIDLSLSSGTLSPTFAPGTTIYSAGVSQSVASVTVTPVAADVAATIQVNGITVDSGVASAPVALVIGHNTIRITVTAQDGSIAYYTINMTRWSVWIATFDTPGSVPMTVPGYTAGDAEVIISLGFAPTTGTSLTLLNNTGTAPINGQIPNLLQGQIVTLTYQNASYRFAANYYGGTGNDLVLQWADCTAFAWGSNNYGQLGNDGTIDSHVPAEVNRAGGVLGKPVLAVSAGYYHSIALCMDGTVAAWGYNTYGQLGDNSTGNSQVPVAVATAGALAGRTVVAIAAGYHHNLALCSDGSLVSWGRNNYGQLGNNSTTNSSVPVEVDRTGVLLGKSVIAISAGDSHNLVLCSDGTVVAWGNNSSYQVGFGGSMSLVPGLVPITGALAGKQVVAVTAGGFHSLALCADDSIAAWGRNNFGQLGNNSTSNSYSGPVPVTATGVLAGKTVAAISAGDTHNLVSCTDGTLISWGSNHRGQLGNNSTATTSGVPVLVDASGTLAGRNIISIDAGYSHCMALCADGSLAIWGWNFYGQLGNDSTTTSSVPVLVDTGTLATGQRFVAAVCGLHSMAVVASPPPPVATTLAATDITATGALLHGSVNPLGASVSVSFEYGPTTGYGFAIAATPSTASGNSVTEAAATVRGLSSGVICHYRIVATNPYGTTTGADMIFTTNSPPVFASYVIATPFQTPAVIPLRKLLAKAVDADGDAITVTAAGPASASGGIVALLADSIRYTPLNGFSGADSFQVTITDSGGASVTGTVTVNVGPAPNAGGIGSNPPVLTMLPGGKVGISFQGIPGRSYLVQRSVGDLEHWETLATLTADDAGKVSFTDDNPPPGSAFYRLGVP